MYNQSFVASRARTHAQTEIWDSNYQCQKLLRSQINRWNVKYNKN
jgi:hypothetical protein